MIKPDTLLVTLILLVAACNGKSSKVQSHQVEATKTVSFNEYVSSLKEIPLPLEYSSLNGPASASENYNKAGFLKYKHVWTSYPQGIFLQDQNIMGLVHCSIGDWGPAPFLSTYDSEGNKIDSLSIFQKSRMYEGYSAVEYVSWQPDRTIIVLDTVKEWKLDQDDEPIPGSLKISTGKSTYKINNAGKIVKF